jgi:hypothetical protein
MSVSSDAAPHASEMPDLAHSPPAPDERPVGSHGAPPPLGSSGPVPWSMAIQAAVALLLIGATVLISMRGLDDRNLRLHHLEHAALLCGGGLLGLLVSRRVWPPGHDFNWERRPWLRLVVLGILLVEPLVLMAVMIPFTSPWIDAHPPIHALEHLLLIFLGGMLGLLGYLFSPVLGWLVVLVTVAMMAAFAGMALPTREAQVAQTLAIGLAARWW